MIYCHYISHTWDTVTYAYGATIDDITGVVVFHFWKENGIEIVQKPERYVVFQRYIQSVYRRHLEEFRRGVFLKKFAREI